MNLSASPLPSWGDCRSRRFRVRKRRRRPVGLGRRRRRHRDLEGRARPAVRPGEEGVRGDEAEFPKAGTPEYQTFQTQYVAYLVQREEFRQAAADLGIEVTEKDVDKAEDELISSRDWTRKEYEAALKEQGFTAADYRSTLETSVLAQKLYEEVTKDVKVSDQDVLAYYTQNQSQYGTPESRDVRHILIAKKGSNGQVDFEASKARADEIYAELQAGGDFKALAKANSDDPGSKESEAS